MRRHLVPPPAGAAPHLPEVPQPVLGPTQGAQGGKEGSEQGQESEEVAMGLYKKGKNWYVDYRYPANRLGRRVREKVGPVKDEARILLAARLKDMRQGRNPELRQIRPVTFADHSTQVLEQHYRKQRCFPWAKLVIDSHLIPFFGSRMLQEISPKLISEYVSARLAEGISPATTNRERCVLSKGSSPILAVNSIGG